MPSFTYKNSQARKPFEEPGEYFCTVEDFEFKFASSGNEMLVLQLRTKGGALIYDNLVFTENAYWKIDHALNCFLPSKGKKLPPKDEPFELDNDFANENLKGATGWVLLGKAETPSGKTKNSVEAYLPPRKGGAPAQGTTTKPAPATPPTSTTGKTIPAKTTGKFAPRDDDDDNIPF
jgi:hypothetical protein